MYNGAAFDFVGQTSICVFAAAIAQALSQGMLFSQYAAYISKSKQDRLPLKAFVACIMAFGVMQTALEVYKAWESLVPRTIWFLNSFCWTEVLLNEIICLSVQCYLIHRCWKLTRKWWLALPMYGLAILSLAANIYLTITVLTPYGLKLIMQALRSTVAGQLYLERAEIVYNVMLFSAAVLDVGVTSIVIVYFLRSKKSVRSNGQIDVVIGSVINCTWESAAAPMVAMVLAATFFPIKSYSVSFLFNIMTAKLYTHGLLRTLNLRPALRERLTSDVTGTRSFWDLDQKRQRPLSGDVPNFIDMEDGPAFPKRTRSRPAKEEFELELDDRASTTDVPTFTPYHSRPDPVKDTITMIDTDGDTPR